MTREFLADLLDRYQFTRLPNRPRTPAYDLTNSESRLGHARFFVRNYRKSGMSFEKAVAKVAEEFAIDEDKLANFCAGRRGSSRRMKKRRP